MASAKIPRTCEHCETIFYKYPSDVAKPRTGRFCSANCRQESDRIPLIARICPQCSQNFFVPNAEIKRGGGQFCSKKCFYQSNIKTPTEKFWQKINKTDSCWLWTAVQTDNGYGIFRAADGKNQLAHRFSYELHNYPIPENLHVCHKCDVRNCVNPEHLFLETREDNMQDCVIKKRIATKLTEDDIPIIRQMRESGITFNAIASKYHVYPSTIQDVVLRNTWKHVP